ncbi:MAG: hypothetical protein Q4E06_00290 [Lautropia sp.]|nr:hypothetical protein [Lautropia sp.]
MLNTSTRFTITASTLALLLAGCGGSGSGDNTGSTVKDNPAPAAASTLESVEPLKTLHEKAPQNAATPISAQGVRGDVLKTMLEQRACSNPLPAASLNGPTLTKEQDDRMMVSAEAELKPTPYIDNPNPPGKPPATPHFPWGCSSFTLYQPAQPGEYTLHAGSGSIFQGQSVDYVKLSYNINGSEIPYQVTANDVTLGAQISTYSQFYEGLRSFQPQKPSGPLKEDVQLNAPQPLNFRLDERVGYGVLMHWSDQANNAVRMLLLPGNTANQAKVCWHSELRFARRLHCQSWNVPASWQHGQTLEIDDQYLIDDRSTYVGESGLLYWHSKRRGG